jgi:hypothetical protein
MISSYYEKQSLYLNRIVKRKKEKRYITEETEVDFKRFRCQSRTRRKR